MKTKRSLAVLFLLSAFVAGTLVSAGQNVFQQASHADTWSVKGMKSTDAREGFSEPVLVLKPDSNSKQNLMMVVQYDEINGPVLYSWIVKANGNLEEAKPSSLRLPIPPAQDAEAKE